MKSSNRNQSQQQVPAPPPVQVPAPGRIVMYTITEEQANQINRRRTTGESIAERLVGERWHAGAQAHIGNPATAGDQYPMILVRVWSTESGSSNGQALLDGNDSLWVMSAERADEPTQGKWHWPERK